MHPDTRTAILAMLNGIEQQIQSVRTMLIGIPAPASLPLTAIEKKQQATARSYLSDEEDEELARELGMVEPEKQQDAVQALMQQALTGMAPYSNEQRNASFLRGAMGGE